MAIGKEKSLKIHEQRRKQILEVARRLFDQNGYSNTRISDISQETGISKGLVYRYFESKEDILFAFIDAMNECLDELRDYESPRESLKEFAVRLLSPPGDTGYIPPLRIYVTVAFRAELDHGQQNPITENFGKEYFCPIFRHGQEVGEFRDGDPLIYADMYWHYLLGCLTHFVRSNGKHYYIPDLEKILDMFS